jgi:chaperonin GroEL (HSP60 family)
MYIYMTSDYKEKISVLQDKINIVNTSLRVNEIYLTKAKQNSETTEELEKRREALTNLLHSLKKTQIQHYYVHHKGYFQLFIHQLKHLGKINLEDMENELFNTYYS